MLHNQQGQQAVERTLPPVWEHFHWNTMTQGITNWVKMHIICHAAKGPYSEPNTKQRSIIVNNPMDLLCIDLTKMDPCKNSKEAVYKCWVAVVQNAKPFAKALANMLIYTYGISARIHSENGKGFYNSIYSTVMQVIWHWKNHNHAIQPLLELTVQEAQ